MSEHQLCKALMDWVRLIGVNKYPCLELFHHVYNEGKRAPWKAKQLGILSGLPDYHLPVAATYGYCGFWLEMKDTGKKPTKVQLKIMDLLRSWGSYVCWKDNIHDAVFEIEQYCKRVTR